MSGQNATLLDAVNLPGSHPLASREDAEPQSHGRSGPDSPWCRCGRPREACVSDEVRNLWHHLLDPSGQ